MVEIPTVEAVADPGDPVPAKQVQRRLSDLWKKRKCGDCGAALTIMEISFKGERCAVCMLQKSGLQVARDEPVVHAQGASYREGLPDNPVQTKKPGFICVARDNVYYFDEKIRWRVAWERVRSIDLDTFKMSGLRAVLAGTRAIMMQNVKNTIAITHFDDSGNEWCAKFP